MALWGNKDTKSVTGTIAVTNASGAVVGTSTTFTTELKTGQTLVIDSVEYRIAAITSNTALTITPVYAGSTGSGLTVTANEQPAYIGTSELADVYFADTTEVSAGGDNVVSVAVVSGGTRYLEVPAVTFSGGGGSNAAATASISGGAVSSIAVTNVGSSYATVPTVAIALPKRTIPTSGVNTTDDEITYTAHGLTTGEAVKYFHGGSTAITGLSNNTTYYVVRTGANTFKLAASEEDALDDPAVVIDLTGTGNNAQYFEIQASADRATATAAKGSGATGTQITHSGWVKRTVGTGGRAGRIQYETLVAMGTAAATSGDAADDLVLPDA
jgi:hypothetical protein